MSLSPVFKFVEKYIVLTSLEKQIIESTTQAKKFPKGSLVSLDSGNLYFVLNGCVAIEDTSMERKSIVDFFTEGDPILLPTEDTSIYQAYCVVDSVLAVSSAAEGEILLKKFPQFETVCRKSAEERLLFALRFAQNLKQLAPIDKYNFLVKERSNLLELVPQHLLAAYLGLSPEALSRARNQGLGKK